MRLAKFLAHAGVASRRAAEAIVAEGRVTVDGEVVTDPARDVDETSGVALDGRPVAPEPHEVHALNKPAGVVSTARDTHGRPTVVQLVRSPRRLYPVGRLDADTTGLILLTNDGDLADRLTHPRYGVKKVYRARVQPARVSPRALEALRDGVELDDGRTAPAQARQPAPGVLELTIREGRKRQVRRMVEAVGHRVVELERVAFGPLGLRGLEPGKSRRLTKAEVERLRRLSEPGAERAGARGAAGEGEARGPKSRPTAAQRSAADALTARFRPHSCAIRAAITARASNCCMRFLSSRMRGHATAAPAAWRALGRGGAGYSATSDHGCAGYPSRAAGTIRRRMQLRALRGAITVEENEADAILSATEELVREVMERNSLEPDRMVSCIFTCTNDLDAEFPAVAARRLGLSVGAAPLRPRDRRARGAADA